MASFWTFFAQSGASRPKAAAKPVSAPRPVLEPKRGVLGAIVLQRGSDGKPKTVLFEVRSKGNGRKKFRSRSRVGNVVKVISDGNGQKNVFLRRGRGPIFTRVLREVIVS